MLIAVARPTARLGRAASAPPRGFCECQDGSHPLMLTDIMLPADVAGHSFRAPFVVPGPRFLHTTRIGAFPICGACHELGHMSVGGPDAPAEPGAR